MSLIIVILVLALIKLLSGAWPAARSALVVGCFRVGLGAVQAVGLGGRIGLALIMIAPVAVVGWLQWWLGGLATTLPWFAFSTFILLLAWGARDLDQDVENFVLACDETDAEKAADPLISSYRKPHPRSSREAVVKGVFYQGLVRWFGVLFWFLIAGPAGALAFRLPHAALVEDDARRLLSARQIGMTKRIAAAVDVIPAVLTTLALALVGNFDAVVAAWRAHLKNPAHSGLSMDYEFLPEVGFRTVCEGDPTEDAFDHGHETACSDVRVAMNLVWRIFIAWLSVVALLTLVGWVS